MRQREEIRPREEVMNRLRRRPEESILHAINRLSERRYRLYRMRDHHEEEDEDLWLEELVACDILLESLWEMRRIELREEYEDPNVAAPAGELISEVRAKVMRRRPYPRIPKIGHSLLHQPEERFPVPGLARAKEFM